MQIQKASVTLEREFYGATLDFNGILIIFNML